jgi:tRNA pseudouridine13 synthase
MFGEGVLRTQAAAAQIEQAVASRHEDLLRGLTANGMRQERRALVLRPGGLSATSLPDAAIEVLFNLKKGSYATVIIREICSVEVPYEQSP